MENLIADGRIHPARIEEMFGKAEEYVNQRVQEAGEQATFDTGIHDRIPNSCARSAGSGTVLHTDRTF